MEFPGMNHILQEYSSSNIFTIQEIFREHIFFIKISWLYKPIDIYTVSSKK